jgi:hypothetical protein
MIAKRLLIIYIYIFFLIDYFFYYFYLPNTKLVNLQSKIAKVHDAPVSGELGIVEEDGIG